MNNDDSWTKHEVMTVKRLADLIDFLRRDGLRDDSPVIIVSGNPHVSSRGAQLALYAGYYRDFLGASPDGETVGQVQSFYLSINDPCYPFVPPWDKMEQEILESRRNQQEEASDDCNCG